jgi:hypothetical protein
MIEHDTLAAFCTNKIIYALLQRVDIFLFLQKSDVAVVLSFLV